MKKITSLLALLFATSLAGAFDHTSFDRILKTYVNGAGQVSYAALKAKRAPLDAYLEATGSVSHSEFSNWSESKRLAFLINVYNAETLQLIIDHYPTSSIKKIGGLLSNPWEKKSVILFGETTTLNHLEHRIIRKEYDEPRIHFALVCAAKGCPPLRREAFTADKLDRQLEDQTRTFLSQSDKNRVEGSTVYLSPIFDWYGKDFISPGNTLNDYVNPYFDQDIRGRKIRFSNYDWSLNES